MLTQLEEQHTTKAHCYWPETTTKKFGSLIVTENRHSLRKYYDIRSLTISDGEKERKIYHIQCTSWPDFGVPDNSEPVLELIKVIQKYQDKLKVKPSGRRTNTLFHCSAGIGRCGSLLSIQTVLQQLENGTSLSQICIPDVVRSLRTQRLGMVQTKEQYTFIYKVVNDFIRQQQSQNSRGRRRGLGKPRKPLSSARSEVTILKNSTKEHRLSQTLVI